jgi:hypothetical protein
MQERKPGCICELDKTTGEPLVANYGECPYHKPDAITPKQTADALIKEFSAINEWVGGEGFISAGNKIGKKSADMCVDKLLGLLDTFQNHEYAKVLIPYYKEVKKEIELL